MRVSSSSVSGAPVTSALRPAFVTAVAAALLGLGVAFAGLWLAGAAGGSPLEMSRDTARVWLVAHGSGLTAGGIEIGLLPIGALLLVVLVVRATARWSLSGPVSEPAAFAATAAGAYGAIAAVVSSASDTQDVTTSTVRVAFLAFALAGAGAVAGYVRDQGPPEAWWPPERPELRAVARGATSALLTVLAAAAVVVSVLLARSITRAGDLWALLDPDAGGAVALAATSLLAVPTLILWAASAMIGPGFAVGPDTSVDLTGSYLGEVPGFPVLAALPDPGEFSGWVVVLALVPAVAGLLAGWRLVRGGHLDTSIGLLRAAGVAALAGAAAGLLLAIVVRSSGGSIGPGRMSEVGPQSLSALLIAVPVIATGAAIGAVLAHYRGGRATSS